MGSGLVRVVRVSLRDYRLRAHVQTEPAKHREA